MSNSFFSLSPKQQLGLIKQAGEQLDMTDVIIEKDLWLCWVLEKLFELPIQMAFKGGTSLSKAFSLIKRFSEDCDITIDYRNFKPTLNLKDISRAQIKKIGGQLKVQLKNYVSQIILPYLQSQVIKSFPDKLCDITLSEDGEQLRFYYPSLVNSSLGYLRDHILIEFGVRNSTEPCEKQAICSYLAKVVDKNIRLPYAMVNTLSPIRTFWEKATLMHVECHRDRLAKTPERLSRHWYDLFMLNNSWVGQRALSSVDILMSVVEHKKAFFNANYTNYDDCINGKFRLIPSIKGQKSLSSDFLQMIDAGMFYDAPINFNTIIKSLKTIEEAINNMEKLSK